MAFPDIAATFDLLGYRVKDRITGVSGVVTSVCFDLYGCVQAAVHPGVDKDGKVHDQHWYDVARLERAAEERVMTAPDFGSVAPSDYTSGPESKPAPRAV